MKSENVMMWLRRGRYCNFQENDKEDSNSVHGKRIEIQSAQKHIKEEHSGDRWCGEERAEKVWYSGESQVQRKKLSNCKYSEKCIQRMQENQIFIYKKQNHSENWQRCAEWTVEKV